MAEGEVEGEQNDAGVWESRTRWTCERSAESSVVSAVIMFAAEPWNPTSLFRWICCSEQSWLLMHAKSWIRGEVVMFCTVTGWRQKVTDVKNHETFQIKKKKFTWNNGPTLAFVENYILWGEHFCGKLHAAIFKVCLIKDLFFPFSLFYWFHWSSGWSSSSWKGDGQRYFTRLL